MKLLPDEQDILKLKIILRIEITDVPYHLPKPWDIIRQLPLLHIGPNQIA